MQTQLRKLHLADKALNHRQVALVQRSLLVETPLTGRKRAYYPAPDLAERLRVPEVD